MTETEGEKKNNHGGKRTEEKKRNWPKHEEHPPKWWVSCGGDFYYEAEEVLRCWNQTCPPGEVGYIYIYIYIQVCLLTGFFAFESYILWILAAKAMVIRSPGVDLGKGGVKQYSRSPTLTVLLVCLECVILSGFHIFNRLPYLSNEATSKFGSGKESVSARPGPILEGTLGAHGESGRTPSHSGLDLDGPKIGPRRGSGWHPQRQKQTSRPF